VSASPSWDRCKLCGAHTDTGCDCAVCADCRETYGYEASRDGLCEPCSAKASALEEQLEASLSGKVASRFDLPSEAELVAIDAQLARLLREGPPRRQGIAPIAKAQKE
jgi:hypothetical protein